MSAYCAGNIAVTIEKQYKISENACLLQTQMINHKMTKSADTITDNFEQQLNELEQIVNRMEQGELSLENSIKEFEHGMKIANQCQKSLEAAELRVKVLMSDIQSGAQLADFDAESSEDHRTSWKNTIS